tara:strand:- start:156 stop:590 length:435 start_codon:yes stop_codon:yes gene_type:complete
MTRKRHMFIYIIMLAICIVAMPGCDGGFERPLDKNFYILKTSYTEIAIYRYTNSKVPKHDSFADKSFDVVVDACVREYSVLDDVIIGRVQKPDGLRKSSSTLPGYFSIDRNTGQVTSGLSRDELDTHLRDQYRTQLIDSFTQIR